MTGQAGSLSGLVLAKTGLSRRSFSERGFFWIHDVVFFDMSRQQQLNQPIDSFPVRLAPCLPS
jgi:hypothetical protein